MKDRILSSRKKFIGCPADLNREESSDSYGWKNYIGSKGVNILPPNKKSPKEVEKLADEEIRRKDELFNLLFSKNRKKREFRLVHLWSKKRFFSARAAKKALIDGGLHILDISHVDVIQGRHVVELVYDRDEEEKVLKSAKYLNLSAKRTYFLAGNIQVYYDFVIEVKERLIKAIGEGARTDRKKFLKQWNELARTGDKDRFKCLFYNEEDGVGTGQSTN